MNKQTKPSSASKQLRSAFELFSPSIAALKLNIRAFVILGILPTFFFVSSELSDSSAGVHVNSTGDPALTTAIIFSSMVVAVCFAILMPAFTVLELASAKGHKMDFKTAFKAGLRFIWRYIGLSLLVGLIVAGGLLLLVVPGIFMLRRYILAPYYLVDRDLTVMEALKMSGKESAALPGPLWGLVGVQFLLCVPNFIPIVGAFIGYAFQVLYFCAPAVRYFEYKELKLSGSHKTVEA